MTGATDEKYSVWYRTYVLGVLLLVCICNLSTRNQPSYLITIPVPKCDKLCDGVGSGPTCEAKTPTPPVGFGGGNRSKPPSKKERCEACRAEPMHFSGANPRNPPVMQLPPHDKEAVAFSVWDMEGAMDFVQLDGQAAQLRRGAFARPGMSVLSTDVKPFKTKSEVGPSAGYYNMSDGTCLWYWQYGLLIGYGFALVYAVGAVPAGYLCDRMNRVAIVAVAAFAWSVATSMQAGAHDFTILFFWRAIIGLAQAFATPALVSLTIDYFVSSERQRDVALALMTMVGPQLGAGCASFSIVFAEMIGWRWVVLLTGVGGILLAALVLLTVKEPARTEWSAPCALSLVYDEVFEKSRVSRMIMVAVSAKMLAAFSLAAFLPIWYARAMPKGYTNTNYAYWNALAISLAGILSALLGSLVNQVWSKVDSRAPCFIGLVGAAASVPLTFFILLSTRFQTSLSCYFMLLALGESWFAPSMALLQQAVRRSVRGQAVSLLLSVATLGGNLGPALVGFLDGGEASVGMHLLWICATAQVVAAIFFWWTAREISLDPVATSLGNSAVLTQEKP